MPAKTTPLGPGTITLGETGTEVDFSCQVIGCRLTSDVTAEDDVPTMCGDVVGGDRVYDFTISGSLYQDLDDPAGIVAYSWEHIGESVSFTFTPNTAAGTTATGTLVLDPLDIGGDDSDVKMTSDFEWAVVGRPVVTFGPPPLADSSRELVGSDA